MMFASISELWVPQENSNLAPLGLKRPNEVRYTLLVGAGRIIYILAYL